LNESLKTYTAAIGENSEKGGEEPKMKFEELLEKYGKTVEDITFDYEGLTDEELESAFASAFEESAEEDESDIEDEEAEENFAKMSVNVGGVVREFSVSLQDKINALYQLVNDTYADDGTWYDVTVYDEDKYVIMVDYWSGKGYKQSYKVKKDVYTLTGDRVEVYPQWLTQDEINSLDKLKKDYAEAVEELERYTEEPKKLEILNSDDYSLIADNEEFIKLNKRENYFNLSVEDVEAKADAILTAAAKQHKFSEVGDEKKFSTVKPFATPKKKAKRFGSLFDGII
jgi:hypothetical protein